jgi:hypothetical protein
MIDLIRDAQKSKVFTSPGWKLAVNWVPLILVIGYVCLNLFTLRHQRDFSQDYFASLSYLRGSSIYSHEVVKLGNEYNQRGILNAHPPSLILFFIPLAALGSYAEAFIIFTLLSLYIFVIVLRQVSNNAGLSHETSNLFLICALIWPTAIQGSYQGNISFLIASIVILIWQNIHNGRSIRAGIMLGIITTWKFFPGLVIFYFLLKKQYKAVLGWLLCIVVLFACSLVVFGFDSWQTYVNSVAPRISNQFMGHYANVSIWAYIMPWFSLQEYQIIPIINLPQLGHFITMIVILLMLLASFHATQIDDDSTSINHAYWLWTLSSVLISPVSWQYSLTFLVIPLLFLLKDSFDKNQNYLFTILFSISIGLLLANYDAYSILIKNYPATKVNNFTIYTSYLINTRVQPTSTLALFGVMWFTSLNKRTL